MKLTYILNDNSWITRQDRHDLEKLREPLERGEKTVPDTASWLMTAYFESLYCNDSTTFGQITEVYRSRNDDEAGFIFEDMDSHKRYRVTVIEEGTQE